MLSRIASGELEGAVAGNAITTIDYIVARFSGRGAAEEAIGWILGDMDVVAEGRDVPTICQTVKTPATPGFISRVPSVSPLEFIGEDVIDHTPQGNEVLIKIGQSFDVTGERTQTDFRADYDGHRIEETVKIKVKNAKDAPQKVLVRETLYRWVNWKIIRASHEHETVDSRTVHFPVTVRYTW